MVSVFIWIIYLNWIFSSLVVCYLFILNLHTYIDIDIYIKVGLSPSKVCFICLNENRLKMMKNVFYFTLKAFVIFKIFEFLSWLATIVHPLSVVGSDALNIFQKRAMQCEILTRRSVFPRPLGRSHVQALRNNFLVQIVRMLS